MPCPIMEAEMARKKDRFLVSKMKFNFFLSMQQLSLIIQFSQIGLFFFQIVLYVIALEIQRAVTVMPYVLYFEISNLIFFKK